MQSGLAGAGGRGGSYTGRQTPEGLRASTSASFLAAALTRVCLEAVEGWWRSGGRACSKNCGGRRAPRRGRSAPPVEGNDFHSEIAIAFQTAVLGGTTELAFDRDGKHEISGQDPPGYADGGKIRLRGQGEPAPTWTAGDIILTVHAASASALHAHGRPASMKLPVTPVRQCWREVDVPTPVWQSRYASRREPAAHGCG
jgi:DnaJ-class molecular chaperone